MADLTAASAPLPTRARANTRPLDLRDVAALAALAVIGIGIPFWLAAAAGTIGIPNNDDWVYMRGASGLFQTGRIDMPGHTAATIGQLVLVQPLLWLSGGQSWAFTAFGLLMGLIGVVSTYVLARRFVGFGPAVLVVLLLVAFPGFARETATFMTEVPAYALGTLCLLLGVRWLQDDGGWLTLAASLGVGLLAVSIREFELAAPVAILIAAWARNRPEERAWLAGASIVFLIGFVSVLVVAASLPARGAGGEFPISLPVFIGPALVTLAAVLLPALVLSISRRIKDLSPVHVIAGAGLFFLATAAFPNYLLIGNLWLPNGAGADRWLSGTRDPVIAPLPWALTEQLASFAAILAATLVLWWSQRQLARVHSLRGAATAAIRIVRRPEGALIAFLVLYAGGLAVFSSLNLLFDRYLYPMVAAAAILLLRNLDTSARPGRSAAISHAAAAWLVASALVIAVNAFAYDAARFRAGEAAVALGYDAGAVDAGYEWVGYHATGPVVVDAHDYGLMWYDDVFPSFRPCAVLSNSPLDKAGFVLIREDPSAYRQYLFVGPEEPFYLYGSTAGGCPTAPLAAAGRTAP